MTFKTEPIKYCLFLIWCIFLIMSFIHTGCPIFENHLGYLNNSKDTRKVKLGQSCASLVKRRFTNRIILSLDVTQPILIFYLTY